jgi:2-iminobutanoate/2-iminopropanoate deaminase
VTESKTVYSTILRVDDTVYLAGQGGLLADGTVVPGGVAAQTTQTLHNIVALLEVEGARLGDLVQATCFLTDIDDLKLFNEAWDQFFGDTRRPTRATVAVSALPFGLRVEITCLARIPSQAHGDRSTVDGEVGRRPQAVRPGEDR